MVRQRRFFGLLYEVGMKLECSYIHLSEFLIQCSLQQRKCRDPLSISFYASGPLTALHILSGCQSSFFSLLAKPECLDLFFILIFVWCYNLFIKNQDGYDLFGPRAKVALRIADTSIECVFLLLELLGTIRHSYDVCQVLE